MLSDVNLQSNVLIDDNGHALISDIGIYTVVSELQQDLANPDIAESFRWAAPEVLKPPGQVVSRETDVYAYGMTVLEVTCTCICYLCREPDCSYRFTQARNPIQARGVIEK